MLARLVLLFILGFLGYTLFSALLRGLSGGSSEKKNNDPDRMVPCSQCGTYVPETDIIEKRLGGKAEKFCSKECLREFKQKS